MHSIRSLFQFALFASLCFLAGPVWSASTPPIDIIRSLGELKRAKLTVDLGTGKVSGKENLHAVDAKSDLRSYDLNLTEYDLSLQWDSFDMEGIRIDLAMFEGSRIVAYIPVQLSHNGIPGGSKVAGSASFCLDGKMLGKLMLVFSPIRGNQTIRLGIWMQDVGTWFDSESQQRN